MSVLNTTHAVCTTPALDAGGPVLVSLGDQKHGSSSSFYVYETASFLEVVPSHGSVHGGTVVRLIGREIFQTKNAKIAFGWNHVTAMVRSDQEMSTISPQHNVTGVVQLFVASNGVSFQATELFFRFDTHINIKGIYPSSGVHAGASHLTIFGSGFVCGENASCIVGQSFRGPATCLTSSSVACTTSPLPEGNHSVAITNNGVDVSLAPMSFKVSRHVDIVSVQPSIGPSTGGIRVRMVVVGLQSDQRLQCRFGTESVPASVDEGKDVTCVLPPNSVGPVSVRVVSGETVSASSAEFLYMEEALVLQSVPSSGASQGGTHVTLVGRNLHGERGVCRFGNSSVPVAQWTPSSIECVSPQHSVGAVVLSVIAEDGLKLLSNTKFEFYDLARVTGLNPSSCSSFGGDTITIFGSRFYPSAKLSCRFDHGLSLPASFVSSDEVHCECPQSQRAVGQIDVSNDGVRYDSAMRLRSVQSSVISMTPNSGPVYGGSVVTATGAGFPIAGDMRCKFGAILVSASVHSSSEIRCQAPQQKQSVVPFSVGRVDVFLDGPADFRYLETMVIASVQPSRGPVSGGTTTTLTGDFGLFGPPLCRFHGAAHDCIALSSSAVVLSSPASPGPGAVQVELLRSADEVGIQTAFEFYTGVFLASLSPTAASAEGGELVTIVGLNFPPPPLFVFFGPAGVVEGKYLSSSYIECVTPSARPGNVSVSIGTDHEDRQLTTGVFTFWSGQSLISLTPSFGTVEGGTIISVNGVLAAHMTDVTCHFGDMSVRAQTLQQSHPSGTLLCTSPHSNGPQIVSVALHSFTTGQILSTAMSFEYVEEVHISALQPSSGPVIGGTWVQISGSGLATRSVAC
eukprot:481216-Rhodomonas_salina.1